MSPARRTLLLQAGIAAAILVAANSGVAALARTSGPRQKLETIRNARRATDVFIGSSIVDAGFNPAEFDRAYPGARSLNLGIGGTAVVEHYLMLLSAETLQPKRIYYGFYDMQLTDSSRGVVKDLLGSRAMGYYVFPDTALKYYAERKPALRTKLTIARHIPLLVNRGAIWGRVELLRREVGAIGVPLTTPDNSENEIEFRNFERSYVYRFRYWVGRALANHTTLNPAVVAMFDVARRSGASVCMISMPLPSSHRQRFYSSPEWKSYWARLDSLVSQRGGRLIDASGWMPDSSFSDALHLDPVGAADFSRRLAAETASSTKFCRSN